MSSYKVFASISKKLAFLQIIAEGKKYINETGNMAEVAFVAREMMIKIMAF